MFKSVIAFTCFLAATATSILNAGCWDDCCCQSVDFSVGWRRDRLDWKVRDLDSSYVPGHAKSKLHFNDINSYTLSANARWCGSAYYVRLSADYGLTDKGRAEERFKLSSHSYLYHPVRVETSDPIKRRSEVYDFDGAVGYPFTFCCCRLNVIPLIGFSFHRQHLRVKQERDYYCESSSSCSSGYDYYYVYARAKKHSKRRSASSSYCSDDFSVSSSNPFRGYVSSDPFQKSSSDPNIASALGLSTDHETSNYRFTWYGFYLGADAAYALDPCWTLFGEFEGHFLDQCHRKRKSWTGVYFVDEYHKKDWAYGFTGLVGLTYSWATCWYCTITVDYDWWKSHGKHDELHWKKVGANIGLGYMF